MRYVIILLSLFLIAADLPRVDSIVGGVRNMTEIMTYDLSRYPGRTPCDGRISSRFGQRWGRLHAGCDISAPVGTPVYAMGHGIVTFAGNGRGHERYGNVVDILGTSRLTTRYAHLSVISVKVGDEVWRGTKIGEVGNTGRSYGPHCHVEIRINNIPEDPMIWIRRP